MTLTRAYEEVVDFIAAGTSPDSVAEQIEREKTTGLTPDETSRLGH